MTGLVRRLIRDELITEEDCIEAGEVAAREKQSLPFYLAENAIVDGDAIAKAAAEEFGSPIF